ncbi:MAG TPA: hypothetical protein VF590_02130, partial [Isosphaeraceae bacterium]
MTPEQKAGLRATVLRRTAEDPTWVGFWLARHGRSEGLLPDGLAAALGLSADSLTLLSLCRTPRPGHFAEDLRVICRRTGADEAALALVLRQQQALWQWERAGPTAEAGWLMAASDRPGARDVVDGAAAAPGAG